MLTEKTNSKVTRSLVLTLLFPLATVSEAAAQMQWTDKIFLNVNFGYQIGSQDIESSSTFTVYDEDATLSAAQSLEGERPVATIERLARLPQLDDGQILFAVELLAPLAPIALGSRWRRHSSRNEERVPLITPPLFGARSGPIAQPPAQRVRAMTRSASGACRSFR